MIDSWTNTTTDNTHSFNATIMNMIVLNSKNIKLNRSVKPTLLNRWYNIYLSISLSLSLSVIYIYIYTYIYIYVYTLFAYVAAANRRPRTGAGGPLTFRRCFTYFWHISFRYLSLFRFFFIWVRFFFIYFYNINIFLLCWAHIYFVYGLFV